MHHESALLQESVLKFDNFLRELLRKLLLQVARVDGGLSDRDNGLVAHTVRVVGGCPRELQSLLTLLQLKRFREHSWLTLLLTMLCDFSGCLRWRWWLANPLLKQWIHLPQRETLHVLLALVLGQSLVNVRGQFCSKTLVDEAYLLLHHQFCLFHALLRTSLMFRGGGFVLLYLYVGYSGIVWWLRLRGGGLVRC